MTPYEIVALAVFVALLFLPDKMGWVRGASPQKNVHSLSKNLLGTGLIALVWPILGPLALYFGVKRYIFKRGPSSKYFELELLGAMTVSAAGFIVYWAQTHG